MYRAGGVEMIWGRPVETRVAMSEEDEAEALSDGWCFHPLDCEDEEPLVAEVVVEPVKRRPGRPRKVEA